MTPAIREHLATPRSRSTSLATFIAALLTVATIGATRVAAVIVPLASDVWITDRVRLSLILDEDVHADDVHVDTSKGRVTLHGSVASERARTEATELARAVKGVQEVRNLLQVVPSSQQDSVAIGDQSIRRRVEWSLRDDPRLMDSEIVVDSVTDGVVVLGGRADTQSDLVRAIRRAREVQGVHRVASVIDLESIPRDGRFVPPDDTWPRNAPDSWITSAVKLRLMATPDIPALDISVDTEDREVILFGTVASAEERRRAESAALSVAAVRQVDNQLVVVPEAAQKSVDLTDDEIRNAVRTALALEPGLLDAKLEVIVVDGMVELAGTTQTHLDRTTAVREARGIDGVRAVIDKIRVPEEASATAPTSQSTLWPSRPVIAGGSLQ